MAIEKVVNITTKVDDEGIESLNNQLQDSNDNAEKLNDTLEDTNKTVKQTDKLSKGASGSVKAIGTALKAIGIGAIIALFAKFTEVLSKNQKVADFFSTATEALSIAFNDLFSFVFDNIGGWIDAVKSVFENPLESVKSLGNAIKENLVERFMSLLEVFGFISKAIKQVFEGDFEGAWESIKEAGKEGVDVFTGVDDTFGKVGETIEKVTESVVNYTKETVKQAKANVELQNTAQLAAAQQQRLVEQYDRAAEQQRQIRDEERNSIQERIDANNKLGEVLEKQEKSMLAVANAQIAAAQANLNINRNIENQVALTEALANKEAILAQVEGFRSEQLVNDLALKREQIELDNTIADAEKERQLAQLEFEAEQALTEENKLSLQRERLDLENQIILEDLLRKRELFKEGTLARVEAEQEYLTRKQELTNEAIALDNKELKNREIVEKQKLDVTAQTFGAIQAILGENSKAGKAFATAQALINTYQGVTEVLANKTTLPEPFGTINKIASIATVLATGFKAVKDINSVQTLGGGGGGQSGGGSAPSAPSFNVVGTSGQNQLAQALQRDDQPVKAFVVGNNVTSQQELDRNIVDTATIG